MGKSYYPLFFVRKSRSNLEGKAGIYFRITVEKKRSEMSISLLVFINKWHLNKGRAIGTDRETIEIDTHNQNIIYNLRLRSIQCSSRSSSDSRNVVFPARRSHSCGAELRRKMFCRWNCNLFQLFHS